jgi:hypothetical protein
MKNWVHAKENVLGQNKKLPINKRHWKRPLTRATKAKKKKTLEFHGRHKM